MIMQHYAFITCIAVAACASPHEPHRTAFRSDVTGEIRQAAGHDNLYPLGSMEADVEVLQGDPDVAGAPFVIRIRELPGAIVPPHRHPVDEHITVLQGVWQFGFGEVFDPNARQDLPAGSYAFAPAGTAMFGYAPEGAIVQVHGVGPFHIEWLHGAVAMDEAPERFQFARGDAVRGPRGLGRIRQGYASGALVQYEIESESGLHMAHERELSPQ
jgi:quercetin dioxygenase-like cupin family protein